MVGLDRIEGDANELGPASEAVAVGGRQGVDKMLTCARDFVEGREGVARHRREIQACRGAIEDDERFGAVGVEFQDGAQLRRLALREEQRIEGAKEGEQIKSGGFESGAQSWNDAFVDGIGAPARRLCGGLCRSAGHGDESREDGPGRQAKRTVRRPGASSRDDQDVTTDR